MKNKRLNYIDALKGFGIFIVTLGHLGVILPLEKYIYSFHMPLFFFISGYLHHYSDDSFISIIRKKDKVILLPFLCWNLISCLYPMPDNNLSYAIDRFFIVDGLMCWNSPIWFLLVLFIAEVIFISLEKLHNNLTCKFFILIISLMLFLKIGHLILIFKVNLIPLALIFFSLGSIVKEIQSKDLIKLSGIKLIIVLICSLTLSAHICKLNDVRVVYTYSRYGNPILFLIAALAGITFYFLLFKNISFIGNSKLLTLLGKNSLIIMASQFWFIRLFHYVSINLFDYPILDNQNSLKAIIVTLLILIITVFLSNIIKSFYPKNHLVKMIGNAFGIR